MNAFADDYLASIARAAPFADRDWSKETRRLKPSWIIELRYLVLVTAGHVDEARRVVDCWLANLRAEYRIGTSGMPDRDGEA